MAAVCAAGTSWSGSAAAAGRPGIDPAGTGFEYYRHVRIPADEPPPPPPPPQPSEKDLDLDREFEYAFDADEPMARRAPSGDVEQLTVRDYVFIVQGGFRAADLPLSF